MLLRSRGGVLLDLFLILVLLSAGATAWFSRDRWLPLLGRSAAGPPADVPGAAPVEAGRPGAWLQAEVRALLSEAGVAERNVVKDFNEERGDGGGRWVLSTIEIAPDPGFSSGQFLRRLAPRLHRAGLSVMRDQMEKGRWVLELGDRERIFQRLVFHPTRSK